MEFFSKTLALSLILTVLSLSSSLSLSSFSPADNHLVNCGSPADAAVDNRRFLSDSAKSPFCHFGSDASTESIRNDDYGGAPADPPRLYDSARVFTRPSKYEFEISERGQHMVRLHFGNINTSRFDPNNAQFHVLIGELVALRNFTSANLMNPVIKEYLVLADSDKLVIRFLPSEPPKFAFVNAIEVISAPKDLVPCKAENFDVSPNQAFEVVHRVNVGGPKVTPFNDTLWRTWLPDDEYLRSSFGSESVYFGGRIKYQVGGSSREVAPDNVYKSARLIRSHDTSIPDVNLTWGFPVVKGFKYLVRMHFCDIASMSLELLNFNVYVNDNFVLKELDLSNASNWMLASPIYRDFVVDSAESNVVTVSVGPSNWSVADAVDAILNGVEIMKLNNSMGSLDGPDCAGYVLSRMPRDGSGVGILIPLIAAACVVLSLSMVLRKRMGGCRESVGVSWSRLPVAEGLETNVKHGV